MKTYDKNMETGATENQVALLECNLDDSTGEQLAFAMEILFNAGALDVYFTPITMKKNRPAVMLSVICHPEAREEMCKLMFIHTSTIGVRHRIWDRTVMHREKGIADTKLGQIEVKHCSYKGIEKTTVEFESAKKIALEHNLTLEEVYRGVKP